MGLRPGEAVVGEVVRLANSAPKSVITSLAGFAAGDSGRLASVALARPRVGNHSVGRFCGRTSPLARRPEGDPCGFQIRGCRLPPYTGRSLDASQRPSQSPQRDDLLFVLFAQDVTHIVGGYRPRARVNVLNEVIVGRFSGDYVWPVLGDYRGGMAAPFG